MEGWIAAVAQEAGVHPRQACAAFTGALRRLHRLAVQDDRGLTAVVVETRFGLGAEACWHLAALLEIQRMSANADLPWGETLMRLDPSLRRYGVLVEKWRDSRGHAADGPA